MQDESAKKKFEEIRVPLAVVQKKKPDKRQRDNSSPDAGTSLYQPDYEPEDRFEHNDFLSKILKEGEGKSQGKRIALIGEPGAGKTTLLQSIADWVLEQKLDFPVWISLADLVWKENVSETQTYIFDTWLQQTFIPPNLTEEVRTDFYSQIEQGKVWLLLDGVDEMLGGKDSYSALAEISRLLTGWINHSRVVLTCRLNVWQADFNPLEFETYRLLNFDYPQVQQFIDNWFRQDVEKGKRLKAELDKAERRRLQDLVKNPLRLTLLCLIWEEEEGNLPKTKAGLYGRYRRFFYTWKPEQFQIAEREQQELNLALGKLALRDINEGSSRFRMRKSFIDKELGYAGDENSHFYKAFKIGWLNHVGYAAESDSREKVYAFYHATFEEYFAALAVESWHYFLRHDPDEPETGTYRIFEPQWREVILLWLGREDVDDEPKNQFIQSLMNFSSGCGDFYEYQAYFLAAIGIAEFSNCQYAKEIVEQVVRWGCIEESVISQEASKALLQTEPKKAIESLSDLLADNTLNNHIHQQVAKSLGQIDPGNLLVIKFLSDLLAGKNLLAHWQVSTHIELAKTFGSGNLSAIKSMIDQLADNILDNLIRRSAALFLGRTNPGNSVAIKSLSDQLADNTLNDFTRIQVVQSLGHIDSGNLEAIEFLSDQFADNIPDDDTREAAAQSLQLILTEDRMPIVIAKLKNYSESNTHAYELIWQCAQVLPYPKFYQAWHGKL